jgi:hypothetical protein
MDAYPWAALYPITVHPGFAEAVRTALAQRVAPDHLAMARWREVLPALDGA